MKNPIKTIKRRIKYYKGPDRKYRGYWYSCPVNEKSIMVESGRGETVNGNMFAILRELRMAPEWKEYQVFFVVTDKTEKDVGEKIRFYGIEGVHLVKRMSDEYLRLLASCKYFFSDNTYPDLFCKKPDQVLANTWHGTPLKHMGRANIEGARGIGNVQRNYFMADYSLFPNEFTRDVFLDDYMLRYEFSGDLIMLDYPRNDALFDESMRTKVRRDQDIENKKVYAYMPTWRGGDAKNVSTEAQLDIVSSYLEEIDSKLSDDQIFYVNMHPFVASKLTYDSYKHIREFPKEYETYDFLGATDALVTDYSSVMFDYAGANRKIALFTYDLEEYIRDRGMYIEVKDLPFDICRTVDELMASLSDDKETDYSSFIEEYCKYREDGKTCTKAFLNLVINNKRDDYLKLEKPKRDDNKPIHVVGVPNLNNGLSDELRKTIEKRTEEGRHVMVAFEGGIKETYIEAFKELDKYKDVEYYSLIGGTRTEDNPREVRRVLPGWRIDSYNTIGNMRKANFGLLHGLMPVRTYSINDRGESVEISFKQKKLSYLDHAYVCDTDYPLERNGDAYKLEIPKEDLSGYKYKNQIGLIDSFGSEHRIIAGRRLDKIRRIIYTKLINLDLSKGKMACYLQEFKSGTALLVRDANYTDSIGQQIVIGAAYVLAKISGKKNRILLFEKNSERYEESASVLYEKLQDRGYKNAYYVLNKNVPAWKDVPPKYRKNLLPKYSFRHYYNLFKAGTIMATETVTHVADLRPISPFLKYWYKNSGFNYVFLQHGVMYMISLDSESRNFFKFIERPGYVNRIVVSSKLEAEHFVYRGDFAPEELYICGLLKFDYAKREDVHDRIVIMPTWRPWEAVLASENFRETTYYKFVEKIYNAVPDEHKDKVIVLPHPLIKKYAIAAYENMADTDDNEIVRLMLPENTHEEVLRKTDTLITDYSSIAYDAFYRGANVIFDWEEKDFTVSQYGATARLMLTEDLAFGKVCYNAKELKSAIESTYGKPHSEDEEKRFSKIVEFHDGKNTERFIEMVKKDGLL